MSVQFYVYGKEKNLEETRLYGICLMDLYHIKMVLFVLCHTQGKGLHAMTKIKIVWGGVGIPSNSIKGKEKKAHEFA